MDIQNVLSNNFINGVAKTVDQWLDSVDYTYINEKYVPSPFALKLTFFIMNIVNDGKGDSEPTPAVHLKMLSEIISPHTHIVNLCSRGLAKTTLFGEYLFLYIACFGGLDDIGRIEGALYVADSMDNGAKSLRTNIEARYNNSENLKEFIPEVKFTDQALWFKNKNGQTFKVALFGAKSGIRGRKMEGKRPKLALLDDLMSDEDAMSPTEMAKIKDTIYKGVNHALDPKCKKIIFNGTPFNKNDPLYEAVESGGWLVNVYPICERFPCEEHEFRGAWPERFSYAFVKAEYEFAVQNNKLDAFNQELMLRISNPQDRIVEPEDIRWYKRTNILANMSRYNFYITTDFATSTKQTSDYSVIFVWAYDNNGNWFLVDGICRQQDMRANIDDLFRLAQMYEPESVGIEVSGQQKGFIAIMQMEMANRNHYFTLAKTSKTGEVGIRPYGDKVTRFKLAATLFSVNKIFFPQELKSEFMMVELMEEISMAMKGGFKSKNDDCLDNISMLPAMNPIKPSSQNAMVYSPKSGTWEMPFASTYENGGGIFDSYIP